MHSTMETCCNTIKLVLCIRAVEIVWCCVHHTVVLMTPSSVTWALLFWVKKNTIVENWQSHCSLAQAQFQWPCSGEFSMSCWSHSKGLIPFLCDSTGKTASVSGEGPSSLWPKLKMKLQWLTSPDCSFCTFRADPWPEDNVFSGEQITQF